MFSKLSFQTEIFAKVIFQRIYQLEKEYSLNTNVTIFQNIHNNHLSHVTWVKWFSNIQLNCDIYCDFCSTMERGYCDWNRIRLGFKCGWVTILLWSYYNDIKIYISQLNCDIYCSCIVIHITIFIVINITIELQLYGVSCPLLVPSENEK